MNWWLLHAVSTWGASWHELLSIVFNFLGNVSSSYWCNNIFYPIHVQLFFFCFTCHCQQTDVPIDYKYFIGFWVCSFLNGSSVKPILQRRAVDFYISDFQSGLRALVKTGYGARVTSYVDDSLVIDVNPGTEELSPEFIKWLGERNLSSDDRMMRMKEG